MKPHYLIAVSALALTAAACGNGPPKARAALECPATQGDLTRTSVSAKSCSYVSSEGAEVTLQLVNVQGGPDATLRAIETNLLALQPVAPKEEAKAEGAKGEATSKDGTKAVAEATVAPGSKDAITAAREAASDAAASTARRSDTADDEDRSGRDGKHRVTVAKGTVIVDDEDGRTRVNMPGIHIDADDVNDTATVDIGPIHVNAGEGGSTFRMRRDVRLRGEQLSREKRGLRAMFLSEKEDVVPDGYQFVGYEAGGPKVGPLTVAVVKSKSEINQGDEVYKAIRRLVRRNGGV